MNTGAEAGIKYTDLLDMSWVEFDYTVNGYMMRMERGWDYVRTLLSAQYSTAFGAKKAVTPKEIMKLPNIDVVREKIITTTGKVSKEFVHKALSIMDKQK